MEADGDEWTVEESLRLQNGGKVAKESMLESANNAKT